ncbi:hypothetical protein E8E12_010781 [Didymella heteroderae]|uniref:Uncharacterized protein n=1 Tax=Didymella heteroderae TaxID=1769908 RepID=A0A9P4X2L7_9PLEO|nr:hypothetical protein E8E12_010781 [Didymella heteroderae]
MAGRILPVALATISGVAIGMATFGEELKAQQMKRLTEEYNRDLAAAAAAANSENPAAVAPAATAATPPPAATPSPIKGEPAKASWSDTLGLWAWKSKPQQEPVPASLAAPAVTQGAPVRPAVEGQIKKP